MVGMPEQPEVHVELRRSADIALARRALRRLVAAPADDALLIDVLLAASELMSNALEHTNGAGDIRARWRGDTVRVDVGDADGVTELTASMPGPLSDHGRGLAIVDAVADRWGTDRRRSGKIVWFEIDRRR